MCRDKDKPPLLCTACGNIIEDFGPNCDGCLPASPVRVLPDGCVDCTISETACAATWALDDQPCCPGCSHG